MQFNQQTAAYQQIVCSITAGCALLFSLFFLYSLNEVKAKIKLCYSPPWIFFFTVERKTGYLLHNVKAALVYVMHVNGDHRCQARFLWIISLILFCSSSGNIMLKLFSDAFIVLLLYEKEQLGLSAKHLLFMFQNHTCSEWHEGE